MRFVRWASSWFAELDAKEFRQFVRLAEEATIIFGKATQPGKFLVDSFPIRKYCSIRVALFLANMSGVVKYVPSWFPGAGFKRHAAIWREGVMRGISEPFQYTKKEMVWPSL